MAQELALEVRGVTVCYGERTIVDVEHLELCQGETLAIMGPNGAGKSTLLRVLGFLEPPTTGALFFQGRPVDYRRSEILELHRRTAFAFDEPLLLDSDVRANVGIGLRLRGVRDRHDRVTAWMRRLGIDHLAARSARTLSSGEAQRVSLARALVLEPEMLLLDEPFAALDPPTRDALLADFRDIIGDTGTATVLLTHDREEAFTLGDRVAIMLDGRIPQIDTPERLFRAPLDEEIARFVGIATMLPGSVISSRQGLVIVDVNGQQVQVAADAAAGDHVLLCTRPEDIVLSRQAMDPSSMRNSIRGRILRIDADGLTCKVVIDCGGPVTVAMTRQSCQGLGLCPGEEALVSFKASAVHLIKRS
jgi:molybdopterin-binding protein